MKHRTGYEDIMGRQRPRSSRHPPMPAIKRAAQFLPFAALDGYDEAVREAGRRTVERPVLSSTEQEELDRRLRMLRHCLEECPGAGHCVWAEGAACGRGGTDAGGPEIVVSWFEPDARKEGGSLRTAAGRVRRLDDDALVIRMEDGAVIPIPDITALEGELFAKEEFCGWE